MKGRVLRRIGIALVVLLLAAIIALVAVTTVKYKLMAYQGDRVAYDYLHMGGTVAVDRKGDHIFFDGPGEDAALVFYPGAAVEPEAYAPLMEMLAEAGTDCYLMRMPLNMPLLGTGKFGSVYDAQKYSTWLIGGHSLGGIAASLYARRHKAEPDGLVFLASYPASDLRDIGIPVLSVTATEDGVINQKALAESRKYLPDGSGTTGAATTDVSIEGGNHSGFGSYGEQDGDRKALIPQDQQWTETLMAIQEFLAGISAGSDR